VGKCVVFDGSGVRLMDIHTQHIRSHDKSGDYSHSQEEIVSIQCSPTYQHAQIMTLANSHGKISDHLGVLELDYYFPTSRPKKGGGIDVK
jgi:hypothetical protein